MVVQSTFRRSVLERMLRLAARGCKALAAAPRRAAPSGNVERARLRAGGWV
jgi:hypothetical protein